MGVCTSCTHKNKGAGESESLDGTSDLTKSMKLRLNKSLTLSAKDIKGFKKADSINSFYDIECSIGQGTST